MFWPHSHLPVLQFDTKPKGLIPLGGCHVEEVARGPKGAKFGLKVSHADFPAGKVLVLAAEKKEDQALWLRALLDCSRVTMENARLGDAMVERARAEGTAKALEAEAAMQQLQDAAIALKREREDKLRLEANQEHVLAQARAADERAAKKEAELAAALAEMEGRKAELEKEASGIQAKIQERVKALADAAGEFDKVQAMLAAARERAGVAAEAAPVTLRADEGEVDSPLASAPVATNNASAPAASGLSGMMQSITTALGGGSKATSSTSAPPRPAAAAAPPAPAPTSAPSAPLSDADRAKVAAAAGMSVAELEAVERRSRALEEEKLRLEREKIALERSVRDMKAASAAMRDELESSEASRARLEGQLADLGSEDSDLLKERQLRRALEAKLKHAEESLARLELALRRNNVKLDVDVFADVKALMAFFEERNEEVRREAQRHEIIKAALKAKRRYLMASAKVEMAARAAPDENLEEADEDDAWGEGEDRAGTGVGAVGGVKGVAAAPASSAQGGDDEDDAWGDDDDGEGEGEGDDGEEAGEEAEGAAAGVEGVVVSLEDELGRLPRGWVRQTDAEGDSWFYCAASGETSWIRPNADGTVPTA